MAGKTDAQTVTITGSLAATIRPLKGKKIHIATPAYGSTYRGPYVRSLFSLLTTPLLQDYSFSFADFDYADVVVARNYLISSFYFNKPECSHLLFLDDDMGFEAAMIADMLALNEDVVGAIYPRRKIDFAELHRRSEDPFPKAFGASTGFVGRPIGQIVNDFMNVQRVGAGVLLISRDCITKMIECCPDIVDTRRFKAMPFAAKFSKFITPFNKIELDDAELSEDYSFCHRWTTQCGGSIWANIARPIQHVGEIVVESRFNDMMG